MTVEEQKEADAKALADKNKAAVTAEQAKEPIVIVGGPGPFTIAGPGLGSKGRLTIGGFEIATTRWDDRSVRGEIPLGLAGEVVLTTVEGTVRKGVYKR